MAIITQPVVSKASLNFKLNVEIGNNQILRNSGNYPASYRTVDAERIEHQEITLQPGEQWASNVAETISALSLATNTALTVNASMNDGTTTSLTVNQLLLLDTGAKALVVTNTSSIPARVYFDAVVKAVPADLIRYGTHAQDGTTNAGIIASLQGGGSVKNKAYTVNATVGKYIYFAYPSTMPDSTFTVNGFTGGFTPIETAININGVLYKLWVSNNPNLGMTQFTVNDAPSV